MNPSQTDSFPSLSVAVRTSVGKEVLDTKEKVRFWLSELSKEVEERLIKDKENG